jgi:hypothetical protein
MAPVTLAWGQRTLTPPHSTYALVTHLLPKSDFSSHEVQEMDLSIHIQQ